MTRGVRVKAMSSGFALSPSAGIRARLTARGAYQWYLGTLFGLVYQVFEMVYLWTSPGTQHDKIGATILLSVFYVGYVFIPPLTWPQSVRARVIALSIYWIATVSLVPFLGAFVIWVWTLIIAMVAFSWLPLAPTFILPGIIVAAQLLIAWNYGFKNGTAYAPFVTITILISMLGITRQIVANRALRDAQAQIATLAAAEERARLARDLHDVLGHSLTVVAVKSELAGRLIDLDPAKAKVEIGDVEALARTALADLRAAVTSYREMNLDSEISAARTALAAAGIESHLPLDGGVADADLRPLFGWVVREGVTNVIRHSGAKECWIELAPRALTVRDDGRAKAAAHGNGLTGLRDRAREAGAELTAASDGGGFVLAVSKVTA
jgi:two-component system sensor histidine kinase DesK